MNKYTFNHNGRTFERITKKDARRAYANGLSIVIIPCNLRPFTAWHHEMIINRADEIGANHDFTHYINLFEYYNCIDSETGKYTAFYIPKEHALS